VAEQPKQHYPISKTLVSHFEQQAQHHATHVALIFEDQQLNYQQLNERANQLAHYLESQEIKPSTQVALYLERGLDVIISILAILKIGAAYVPIDPAYPLLRVQAILEDSQASALLTHTAMIKQTQDPITQLCPCIVLDETSTAIAKAPTSNLRTSITPNNLAYIIYTSGTTGKPKGVMITHANVSRLFLATHDHCQFSHRDHWLLFHSTAFDFSVWELWGALLHGGCLVIIPYWVSRDPEALHDYINQQNITILNQTPSSFQQWMEYTIQHTQSIPKSLRLIILGGEKLVVSQLRPWFEHHPHTPQLINMYGATEITVHATYCPITEKMVIQQSASLIGQPLADLAITLLDNDHHPVPVGVLGELAILGAGLANGYFNDPTLTQEKFMSSPFHRDPRIKLYKTGDLAYAQTNGSLVYLHRRDNQIKWRGFRIELEDISTHINQYPGISQALVLLRTHHNQEAVLAAYFVVDKRNSVNISALSRFLEERLPHYMLPSIFVPLTTIPLTIQGKIDQQALPLPDRHSQPPESYRAPITPQEKVLTDLWLAILPTKKIGVNDNFFQLGGHSLLALRLLASIQRCFGVKLSIRSLFEAPTVAKQCQLLHLAPINHRTFTTIPSPIITLQEKGQQTPIFLSAISQATDQSILFLVV